MDSYMETQFIHLQPPNLHNQHGLLRFRSAPSSLGTEFTHRSTDAEKLAGRLDGQRLNSENGYSGSAQFPPQYPKQLLGHADSSSIQRWNSLDIDPSTSQGDRSGGGLNLNRQSSSPASFFNYLNPETGYSIKRGIWSFKVNHGRNEESSGRLKRLNMNHLPQIPEIVSDNIKESSPEDVFPFTSWNESASDAAHRSESGRLASCPNLFTRQLSLPKTSTEMAAVHKLLRFQDTVPCKVRAKRGFATHPRSIAERVRRNRISERMRKLQELVPNMDKQTNTANMLDLVVEYIKNLQNQHEILSDNRTKCKCVHL